MLQRSYVISLLAILSVWASGYGPCCSAVAGEEQAANSLASLGATGRTPTDEEAEAQWYSNVVFVVIIITKRPVLPKIITVMATTVMRMMIMMIKCVVFMRSIVGSLGDY